MRVDCHDEAIAILCKHGMHVRLTEKGMKKGRGGERGREGDLYEVRAMGGEFGLNVQDPHLEAQALGGRHRQLAQGTLLVQGQDGGAVGACFIEVPATIITAEYLCRSLNWDMSGGGRGRQASWS